VIHLEGGSSVCELGRIIEINVKKISLDAISRFRTETLRIYDVLEARLSGRWTGVPREYLAGIGKGKYSIADIGTWPWVRSWRSAQFADEDMAGFPCLLQWIARVAERPAVQRGISSLYDSEENPELRVSTIR
jgi:glutathione S-transferase